MNRIEAHIEFSFKGETYSLSSNIDLDKLLERPDSLREMHALLANEHGIDTYSYLYEVMQDEEIEFRNPQGIAADFLVNGHFDFDAFAASLQNRKVLALLQAIATRELGITDLDQNEALKNVLLHAYNLGKGSASQQ